MKKIKYCSCQGQAMIMLMFLTVLVTTLVVEIVSLSFSSIELNNDYSQGMLLLAKTEGYLENASLKLLRNPDYEGEIITDGETVCTLQVSNTGVQGQKDLTSSCRNNQKIRKVGMTATYDDGIYQFSPARERI